MYIYIYTCRCVRCVSARVFKFTAMLSPASGYHSMKGGSPMLLRRCEDQTAPAAAVPSLPHRNGHDAEDASLQLPLLGPRRPGVPKPEEWRGEQAVHATKAEAYRNGSPVSSPIQLLFDLPRSPTWALEFDTRRGVSFPTEVHYSPHKVRRGSNVVPFWVVYS